MAEKTGGIDPITLATSVDILNLETSQSFQYLARRTPGYGEAPFGVNAEFLKHLETYASSKKLTPLTVDRYGLPKLPDLDWQIEGVEYVVKPDGGVYVVRRAPDCGPEENRLEEIYLRPVSELDSVYLFYGNSTPSGTFAEGTS